MTPSHRKAISTNGWTTALSFARKVFICVCKWRRRSRRLCLKSFRHCRSFFTCGAVRERAKPSGWWSQCLYGAIRVSASLSAQWIWPPTIWRWFPLFLILCRSQATNCKSSNAAGARITMILWCSYAKVLTAGETRRDLRRNASKRGTTPFCSRVKSQSQNGEWVALLGYVFPN